MTPHRATGDICSRIRYLIDKHHAGNVSEAARKVKVSQRGLQKVYHGTVSDMNASTVAAFAIAYPMEDPMWLLTGRRGQDEARIAAAADSAARSALEIGLQAARSATAKRRKSG